MKRILILLAGVFLPAPGSVRGAEPAPELVALLKKAAPYRPGERDLAWREIPWHDDPTTALQEARAETRPLLVWLAGGRDRDGTPLERC
jgi:hypothetical protein